MGRGNVGVVVNELETYIPSGFEFFYALKLVGDGLVGQQRLVLSQRSLANLRVFRFWDRIFQERLFELVESDNDAEQFGE